MKYCQQHKFSWSSIKKSAAVNFTKSRKFKLFESYDITMQYSIMKSWLKTDFTLKTFYEIVHWCLYYRSGARFYEKSEVSFSSNPWVFHQIFNFNWYDCSVSDLRKDLRKSQFKNFFLWSLALIKSIINHWSERTSIC